MRAAATAPAATAAWLAARMTGRRARARTIAPGGAGRHRTRPDPAGRRAQPVASRSPAWRARAYSSASCRPRASASSSAARRSARSAGPSQEAARWRPPPARCCCRRLRRHILPVIRSLGESAEAQQAVALLTGRGPKTPPPGPAGPQPRSAPVRATAGRPATTSAAAAPARAAAERAATTSAPAAPEQRRRPSRPRAKPVPAATPASRRRRGPARPPAKPAPAAGGRARNGAARPGKRQA